VNKKKSVGDAMNELFSDCRIESNKSYYSVSMCRIKASSIEVFEDEAQNNQINLPDKKEALPF